MLYISLIGFFLSLLLFFYNEGYTGANRYLAAFFFFTAFCVLGIHYLLCTDSIFYTACFTSTMLPFALLIGPSTFMYFRSILTDDCRFRKADYFHLLPFAIYFVGMLPYYFSPWEHKVYLSRMNHSEHWGILTRNINAIIPSRIGFVLRPLQYNSYVAAQWRLMFKYRNEAKLSTPLGQINKVNRWLVFLNINCTLSGISLAAFSVFINCYHSRSVVLGNFDVWLTCFQIALVAGIVLLMLYPQILYGLPQIATVSRGGSTEGATKVHLAEQGEVMDGAFSVPTEDATKVQLAEKGEVVDGSSLANNSEKVDTPVILKEKKDEKMADHQRFEALGKNIDAYIESNKPYLQPSFTAAGLAVALDVPLHHITYYYNQYLGKSFSACKNKWRVAYACGLMQGNGHSNQTIEAIAQMSGFSSKSVFYEVFKTEMGITPAAFQKKVGGG